MKCDIYKSPKKEGTYVYLAQPVDLDLIPEALRKGLGELTFVMMLELSPEKKLVSEDVLVVMKNIKKQGFHLQIPPTFVSLLKTHNPNGEGNSKM